MAEKGDHVLGANPGPGGNPPARKEESGSLEVMAVGRDGVRGKPYFPCQGSEIFKGIRLQGGRVELALE